MNQWTFVAAAYAVTILAGGGITLASYIQMRRAERAAGELRRR